MSRIVVIGAGPAGCSAGYHLAKSGHQVMLIDKNSFPRDKTCGDAISLGSVRSLSSMGFQPQDLKRLASEFAPVDGFVLEAPNGNCYTQISPREGYCIPRLIFDNLLYERAINAGCMPCTQSISNIEQHPELYSEFDYIIDARGVSAGEPNAIAIRAYWTIKIGDFPRQKPSRLQVYFDEMLGTHGYAWVFPVAFKAGLVKLNVGVIVWTDEYQGMNINLIRLFDQFIQQHEKMQELSSKLVSKEKPRVYPLATAKQENKVSQGKILKIGDAANLTDPITGEGIANAVLSGLYVAQAINTSPTLEAAAENWQSLYYRHFQQEFHAALQIKSFKKESHQNNLLIRLMNRNSDLGDQVGFAISGLGRYSDLVSLLK